LVGEAEVLGENLPHCHFVHHTFNLLRLGSNPGRRSGKPAANRLSYGTAFVSLTDEYRGVLHIVKNEKYTHDITFPTISKADAVETYTLHRCMLKSHALSTSELDMNDWSASQSN
jgi:hypothetical protein